MMDKAQNGALQEGGLTNGVSGNMISDREAAVYDRQIRLWGVEAQQSMRNAVVLLFGLRGINTELCKNLVLSGVNVAIYDEDLVTESDLGVNFFLRKSSVGKKCAEAAIDPIRELNPLVKVDLFHKSIDEIHPDDLKQYSLVCAADIPVPSQVQMNSICRDAKVKFLCAESLGFSAFVFVDLGDNVTTIVKKPTGEKNANGEMTFKYSPISMQYSPLSKVLSVPASIMIDRQSQRGSRKRRRQTSFRDMKACATEMFAAAKYMYLVGSSASNTERDELKDITTFLEKEGLAANDSSVLPNVVLQAVKAARDRIEVSPVCAVVGGIIAQEVVKIVSGKDEPMRNMFFFDGLSGRGMVEELFETS